MILEEAGLSDTQALNRYYLPKSVEFIDSLPKDATGKILKTELSKKHMASSE